MSKYLNFGDIVLIALSSYVVVWGINSALRAVNKDTYQA